MLTYIIIASALLSVLWSIRPRTRITIYETCNDIVNEYKNCPPYWVINTLATVIILVLNYFKYLVILLFVYLVGWAISPDIFPTIHW